MLSIGGEEAKLPGVFQVNKIPEVSGNPEIVINCNGVCRLEQPRGSLTAQVIWLV